MMQFQGNGELHAVAQTLQQRLTLVQSPASWGWQVMVSFGSREPLYRQAALTGCMRSEWLESQDGSYSWHSSGTARESAGSFEKIAGGI